MLLTFLAYLGGVLTILSPCILPVLPFVFSRAQGSFRSNGLPLLVGMAITFALVSTLAAVGGAWAIHANQWGRWIALTLLALFAVALLWPPLGETIARPLAVLGARLSAPSSRRQGAAGSVLLGVATGLLWAPCAGPILGLILTAAALKGASLASTWLLLAYGLGAATSLAGVLLAGGGVAAALNRTLPAQAWVRRGLGVAVLIGVAIVASGLDRGLLARLSGPQTTSLEQGLIASLTPRLSNRHAGTPTWAGEPLPVLRDMPSLAGAGPWFNGPALSREALRGKVVLVDFWTYSCINCLRAIPYVEAWAERYRDQGLVVIGVHSPEFAFEKQPANVRKAIREFGVTYPVVMDNDLTLWRAYDNDSWPTHYLIDAQGRVRHRKSGEGEYAKSELVIRSLLAERNGALVVGPSVNVKPQGVQAAADFEHRLSAETYIGYARAGGFVSPGGLVRDRDHLYRPAAAYGPDQWSFTGVWNAGPQQATAVSPGARMTFKFQARDLHLVLGPAPDGRPIRFRVRLDGQPPGADNGVDVSPEGYGLVATQRLYQIVRQTTVDRDRLFEIEFLDPGVQAFTFTFG